VEQSSSDASLEDRKSVLPISHIFPNHNTQDASELQISREYAPSDLARILGDILKKPVKARIVPRSEWVSLFKSQGAINPSPRVEMLDGFNSGWIDFEGSRKKSVKGSTTLETVLNGLVQQLA
jgi:NAD(P)H dehydrogenase (quinone)